MATTTTTTTTKQSDASANMITRHHHFHHDHQKHGQMSISTNKRRPKLRQQQQQQQQQRAKRYQPTPPRLLFSNDRSSNVRYPALAVLALAILLSNWLADLERALARGSSGGRMVRLCIASVDPAKLSSQCVMCNRRDFPLTVIDCTGITKVNDLIANPLSVREATCLIYNCRRQVPDIKPEPYHGSVSHAANYRGPPAPPPPPGGLTGSSGYPVAASGSSLYEMLPPSGMLGGGYHHHHHQPPPPQAALASLAEQQNALGYMSRYGFALGPTAGYRGSPNGAAAAAAASLASATRGLIGGGGGGSGTAFGLPDGHHQQALPYAIVPAPPSAFPFGSRNKYKAALVPLFK